MKTVFTFLVLILTSLNASAFKEKAKFDRASPSRRGCAANISHQDEQPVKEFILKFEDTDQKYHRAKNRDVNDRAQGVAKRKIP
ncbi:MAG: hypothetical protein H7326_04045 [Bdellovibrionaceae bacterium]|nr:hypothetical protein [Pseudobdellovibrionaceae bacterium]